jgi:hypothetical protein
MAQFNDFPSSKQQLCLAKLNSDESCCRFIWNLDEHMNATIKVVQDDEVALNIDISYVERPTFRKDDEKLKVNGTIGDAVPFNLPSTGKFKTTLIRDNKETPVAEDVSTLNHVQNQCVHQLQHSALSKGNAGVSRVAMGFVVF